MNDIIVGAIVIALVSALILYLRRKRGDRPRSSGGVGGNGGRDYDNTRPR